MTVHAVHSPRGHAGIAECGNDAAFNIPTLGYLICVFTLDWAADIAVAAALGNMILRLRMN